MKPTPSSGQSRTVPEWCTEPFHQFLAQADRLFHVVRLSVQGISVFKDMPEIVDLLADLHNTSDTPDHKEKLAAAHKDANAAQREMNAGFPIVFSYGIVALWSLLESLLRTTVVSWLKNDSQSFNIDVIAKIRVRVGEYEQLSQEEKFHYIAQLLETELAAGLRNGVERFEALLKPFDLDGPIPEKLRRDIFEFGQIRNAIVHRGGHTDRQLSTACPWLGFPVGQELPVTQNHFERYRHAAHWYVVLLICRVGKRFGKDVTERIDNVFTHFA